MCCYEISPGWSVDDKITSSYYCTWESLVSAIQLIPHLDSKPMLAALQCQNDAGSVKSWNQWTVPNVNSIPNWTLCVFSDLFWSTTLAEQVSAPANGATRPPPIVTVRLFIESTPKSKWTKMDILQNGFSNVPGYIYERGFLRWENCELDTLRIIE